MEGRVDKDDMAEVYRIRMENAEATLRVEQRRIRDMVCKIAALEAENKRLFDRVKRYEESEGWF